jgi:hypothetical protein
MFSQHWNSILEEDTNSSFLADFPGVQFNSGASHGKNVATDSFLRWGKDSFRILCSFLNHEK